MSIRINNPKLFKKFLKEWSGVEHFEVDIKDLLLIYLPEPYSKYFISDLNREKDYEIEIKKQKNNIFVLKIDKEDKILLLNEKSDLSHLSKNIEGIWGLNISDFSFLKGFRNLKLLNIYSKKIYNLKSFPNLKRLSYLDLSSCRNLSDLSGIENLSNVEELDLSRTKIQNLNMLKDLEELKDLSLNSCEKLKNIKALSYLKNLEIIDLSWTKIENIESLKKLKKIKILNLENNEKLVDISSLRELNNLEGLNLGFTKIKEINSLKNLKKLKELDLSWNNYLTKILPIKELNALEKLDLSGLKIRNISSLKKLVNLKRLELINCDLLRDISPVRRISVEYLDIRGCASIKDKIFLKDMKSLKEFKHDSPYIVAEVLSSNAYNRNDEEYIIKNTDEWITLLENVPELEPLTSDLVRALSIVSYEEFRSEKLREILNIILKRKDIEPKTLGNILKHAIKLENYKEFFDMVKDKIKENIEFVIPVIDSLLSSNRFDKEYSKSFVSDCLKDKKFEKDDLLKIAPSIILFYKIIGDEKSYNEWLEKDELKSTIAKDKINEKFALYYANKNEYEKAEKYINQIRSEKIKDSLYYELSLKTSKTNPLKSGEYFDKIANKSKKLELSKKLMKVKEFLGETLNIYKLTLFLEEEDKLFSKLVESMVENAKPELSQKLISVFSDDEEDKIMKKIMEFLDSELISEYIAKRKLEKFKNRFYDKNELKKLFSKENIMKFLREDNLLDKNGKEDVFNEL